MTEKEWRTAAEPFSMLDHLQPYCEELSEELRLFICACCRIIWDKLDDCSRRAVEVGDRYAHRESVNLTQAYCDVHRSLLPLGRPYRWDPPAEIQEAAFVACLRAVTQSGVYYGEKWEFSEYDLIRCAKDAAARVAQVAAWPAGDVATTYFQEADILRALIAANRLGFHERE
jgi:hypothetical protein